MQHTTQSQFTLIEGSDKFQPEALNENTEKAETILTELASGISQAGNCKIAVGSYVGTGLGGAENPNSLTFDFEPKVMLLCTANGNLVSYKDDYSSICYYIGTTQMVGTSYSATGPWGPVSYSGRMMYKMSTDRKTIYWYHGNAYVPQDIQANTSGTTYYYIAIG